VRSHECGAGRDSRLHKSLPRPIVALWWFSPPQRSAHLTPWPCRMSEWGVYSIVNSGSVKVIVTQANLVQGRRQAYDARNPVLTRGEGRNAGKLFLEAQESRRESH
jgi:hypothetical protein